jgi:ABC-2 type transport system ATP-binding protein
VRKRKARLSEVARTFDLDEIWKRKYGSLSAGQKTRVSLAKSLINEPQVLLMDEPTAALDPASADRVRGWLSEYQHQTGATVLLASHNMFEVERLCDDVVMLKKGRIVDQGAPTALLQRYGRSNLEEVFIDIARSDER